jgi:hypothetical protein
MSVSLWVNQGVYLQFVGYHFLHYCSHRTRRGLTFLSYGAAMIGPGGLWSSQLLQSPSAWCPSLIWWRMSGLTNWHIQFTETFHNQKIDLFEIHAHGNVSLDWCLSISHNMKHETLPISQRDVMWSQLCLRSQLPLPVWMNTKRVSGHSLHAPLLVTLILYDLPVSLIFVEVETCSSEPKFKICKPTERDSTGRMVTCYVQDDRSSTRERGTILSPLQTSFETNQAAYSMVTMGSFLVTRAILKLSLFSLIPGMSFKIYFVLCRDSFLYLPYKFR